MVPAGFFVRTFDLPADTCNGNLRTLWRERSSTMIRVAVRTRETTGSGRI